MNVAALSIMGDCNFNASILGMTQLLYFVRNITRTIIKIL